MLDSTSVLKLKSCPIFILIFEDIDIEINGGKYFGGGNCWFWPSLNGDGWVGALEWKNKLINGKPST